MRETTIDLPMRAGLVLAVLAAAPLAALCAPAATASRAAKGWTRSDLTPISQPVAVAGRFVFYAAAHGRISLLALGAADGHTVWAKPASSAANAPGQPPALVVSGRTVVYLRKGAGETASLAAVDAKSGKALWHTRTAPFTSWPSLCPDAGDIVCLTGVGAVLRFALQTGELLQAVQFASTGAGREIGPGLFDPADRKPEFLEGVQGGAIAWRQKLSVLFTLAGASTDWGWNFDRYPHLGLFIGSPGWGPSKRQGTKVTLDLSHFMTAAFQVSNGAPVWRDHGSVYVCNYLPCPGQSNAGVSSPVGLTEEPTTGIRLRETGHVTARIGSTKPAIVSPGSRVIVEGFDPATGKTRWTFDAGRDEGLMNQSLLPPQTGPTTIVLRAAGGRYVELDVATGALHRTSSNTIGWCRRTTPYKQNVAYHAGNGRTITNYQGQYGLVACSRSGRPVHAPSALPSFLAHVGAESLGLIALSDRTGITALPAAR